MDERIDATNAATAPFQPGAPHETLRNMVGRWSGQTQTWLDPASAPDESKTEVTVESLLGGRWIRIDYQSTVQGKPHAGQRLVGFHKDAMVFEIAWVDSFHTGTSVILSTGAPRPDGAVAVLGSYGAGNERWGWRTVLRQPQPGELVIEEYNISPAGQEDRAVETRLTRR
jgi:hypothetical protein